MKRIAWVASVSLALLAGACDDDDSSKKDGPSEVRPETGSETGSEGGVAGMCMGSFASINRTALGAAVALKTAAMCKAGTDLDLICTQDIGGKIRRDYAVACSPLASNQSAVVACINDLAKRDFPTLSDACLGCYSASVACSLQNCLAQCSVDASSVTCVTCQTTNGCLSAFYTCSGLPGGPTTPATDAATGTDTAGATDGGVDAPVDAPAADAADGNAG